MSVAISVLFWSGVIGFAAWCVVELMEVAGQWARDRQARRRLGVETRPGESAYEERMRVLDAQAAEGDRSNARP